MISVLNSQQIQLIKENVGRVIVGNEEVIDLLLTALFAEGHVLIDDVPGIGKTKLANTLAKSIGADFKRIQFTPDLQPADITGIYYFNQKEGDFVFRQGPVLTNILLADEINRAVPRTQSSLLEAMQERQVSIEGDIYPIQEPFMILATQNPIELEGTFPLPEAQLDRFLLKVSLGYPTDEEEVTILKRFKSQDPLEDLEPVVNAEQIVASRKALEEVTITEELLKYITKLSEVSRESDYLRLGLSPRASLSLMKASLAYAFVKGRDFVLPDDIKYLFPYVAEHRLILTYEHEAEGTDKAEVIEEIISAVEVPVEDGIRSDAEEELDVE